MLTDRVAANDEPLFCQVCTTELSDELSLTNDSLATSGQNCLERDMMAQENDNRCTDAFHNGDGFETDLDPISEGSQISSSKVQSVVSTLMQLEKERNEDSTSIKR